MTCPIYVEKIGQNIMCYVYSIKGGLLRWINQRYRVLGFRPLDYDSGKELYFGQPPLL